MGVLKLDDFLSEDIQVELKGEVFCLDTSFKSFLKYIEWEKQLNEIKNDQEWIGRDKEFLKIIIKSETQYNEFVQLFDTLSLENQTNVLKQLIKVWTENTLPQHLLKNPEEFQKKK